MSHYQNTVSTQTVLSTTLTVSSWFQRLLGSMRARREFVRNIKFAPTAEVVRSFHEVGLETNDLRTQCRGAASDRGALLNAMMNRLGCPAEGASALSGGVLRDLQRVCSSCGDARRCHALMNNVDIAVDEIRFCPNVHTFEKLVPRR